jgi:hypothetical protein
MKLSERIRQWAEWPTLSIGERAEVVSFVPDIEALEKLAHKPVTISCSICGETIYEDEKWDYEYEGDGATHEACEIREREKARAIRVSEINRIRAKEAAGEELTFDEMMVMLELDMTEAMRAHVANFIFRGPGGAEQKIPVIGKLTMGYEPIGAGEGPGHLTPSILYASVDLSPRKGPIVDDGDGMQTPPPDEPDSGEEEEPREDPGA